MVCDRYIYDLWAKEQVDQDYSSLLYPLHFVFNRLQRFPNIAFMITDDPNEIYKRKQELTPAQIENYQKIMSDILKSMGVQTIEIAVAGRKPEEIAREIVIALLSNIDIKIFGIIKDNKINRNSKNIN